MKKRWIMIVLGTVSAVSLTACSTAKKPDQQTETQTTESETETQTTEEEITEEQTTEKETEKKTAKPQTDASMQSEDPVQIITEAPQTMSEVLPSPPVYEEEYLQCPYCSEWFYAQPDGGLWNPYDRHVLSERDRIEGSQQTEQEMAQCPDCLNWYETGNIFRNHICSAREQDMQE